VNAKEAYFSPISVTNIVQNELTVQNDPWYFLLYGFSFAEACMHPHVSPVIITDEL